MSRAAAHRPRTPERCAEEESLPLEPGISGTRGRILRAGLELFADRGYPATSIRDIAARAGIQSASLYTHFASKEAILAQLVVLGHEVHHRALLAAVVACGPDAREQLRALVRAHVTVHCRYARLGVVTNHERVHLDAAAYAPAAALRAASQALAIQVVERGVAQKVFQLIDQEITQVAIASLGISASLWFPSRERQFSPERVGEVYAELALRLVGARDE